MHSIVRYAVRFVMNVNTVHRRPAATIHRANRLSPSECDQFCMESVENDEFHVSHVQTAFESEKKIMTNGKINSIDVQRECEEHKIIASIPFAF